jgi:hypothetical protein
MAAARGEGKGVILSSEDVQLRDGWDTFALPTMEN